MPSLFSAVRNVSKIRIPRTPKVIRITTPVPQFEPTKTVYDAFAITAGTIAAGTALDAIRRQIMPQEKTAADTSAKVTDTSIADKLPVGNSSTQPASIDSAAESAKIWSESLARLGTFKKDRLPAAEHTAATKDSVDAIRNKMMGVTSDLSAQLDSLSTSAKNGIPNPAGIPVDQIKNNVSASSGRGGTMASPLEDYIADYTGEGLNTLLFTMCLLALCTALVWAIAISFLYIRAAYPHVIKEIRLSCYKNTRLRALTFAMVGFIGYIVWVCLYHYLTCYLGVDTVYAMVLATAPVWAGAIFFLRLLWRQK